ncbi:ras-related protein Rab-44 isoform X3 [Hirundo rustica]|uniref:ras-related protein Rab-44 isoform X3 n=1 Tax=Hirundo rustica TaxID=43150 RepID=UPI001A93F140|nr:ras-related protein Rab-44 isoform X3 [Hirundo rustica]
MGRESWGLSCQPTAPALGAWAQICHTPQPRTITNQDGMGTLLHSLQHLQCLCRAALGSGGSGSFPPPACSAANRKRAAPAVECHPRTESALSKRDESGARGSSGALGVGAVSPVTWGAPRVPQHRASLSARAEGAMSERRAAAKGRRLGSSRRKQLREGSGETPAAAPSPGEEPPWASEIVQRVQQLLADRDAEQAAVVTRSDVQKLHEEGLPCSREELELVFDGLDAAGTGRLGTEEFTAGLPGQFLSSQKAAREHRRRKTASRRVQLVLPVPLAGVDSEERRHFAAFMEQLGTGDPSEEQEIWQLWVKLRQDEPQLLDNLEDFLAKMRHRIQEARSEKEALELTLNKRVAEHDKDVQQLCEVLEQQIQQEQLRLQQQSTARSQQQGEELQRVLDASESEVQRLVTAQAELERRCRSLQSSQQVTSTENRQLEESNRALEHHLQHLHQQLQHTQRRLRTMRAAVVWEHTGEPGDRVVAELPIEVPMSPQLSPGKSEKFRSEMRIRLGSQSGESNAKSTHQVVWEMLPAETNLSGAPRKASSAEEDPFPEPLKEEGVSDQSSLLREMNDAIAALSKHLKAQALGAPPALADTPWHPWDNAEPQTGPEAATARETTPGVLQETLPGHVHRELLEGDQQEGRGTAELRAPDVTQAGASTGATGHCTAQEPGAEQGHGPEEAQGMLFLQGKGAGEEEMVQNVAEQLGESVEAGEQVLMEVEGAGWLQEKTAWAKPQLLREAEEVEIRQRENLEAVLGPPEAGQEGRAVAQCLAMDEQQPGRTLGGCAHAPGTALQEWAHPASGLPGKLETELGEHLEPEPPSWGEAQVEAARGGGVPEVTAAPGPGVLDEERARTEVQHRGETTDSKVLEALPARAERAGSEEEEVEEAEPREAEQQLQDVWRLCAPGQAAQRELQEQVSAQGHEGRLHTVAQQPEGKMEPEHTAAEHPKREVPPASTLHTTAQPADAGSDQLGMVLRDNSLGKRQRLGEQSKDLGVGQREKMQEFGQKMSREGEPSPGEPGAVTAGGAGAAPRGCPKAPLDPDHVYNVLFVGDSHVGKTSFLYRLHADTFNPHLAATVGLDYQIKTLVVDNKSFALRLWDSAGQERYRSVTKQFFRKADGVVLMYDITSEYSFSDVRYWLGCIQDAAEDGIAVLLLGNKTDCAAQRQVPTKEGECLAKEHQLMFYECSAASGHNVFESMVSFVRLLKVREDELKNKAEEVPKAPEKKKGCCW